MNCFRSKIFGGILTALFLAAQIALLLLVHKSSNTKNATSAAERKRITSSIRHATNATLCPEKDIRQLQPNLKSQSREDQELLQWFNGLCHGTYLEMGAFDGIIFSNSYVFNEEFSWKGLLIEFSPKSYFRLLKNRPNEIALVNAAVCREAKTVHFVRPLVEDSHVVDGIWELAAPSFRDNIWQGLNLTSPQVQPIQCLPLNEIIQEHVGMPAFFDFFSLDVEGAELDALLSIDFSQVGFGIIFVEQDGRSKRKEIAIRTLLETNGYIFLEVKERSGWFINKHFWDIYKDVIQS